MKNIVDYLPASDKLAIVEGSGRSITFNQLAELYEKQALRLRKQGVERGTRVLFVLQSGPGIDLYANMLACFSLGAEIVFIDPSYSAAQVFHCLKLAKPQAVLFSWGLVKCEDLAAPTGKLLKSLLGMLRKISGSKDEQLDEPHQASANLNGLITFTSGSTGLPRGIRRDQDFLALQAELIRAELHVGNYQSELLTLPIFVLSNLAQGVTSYLTSAIVSAKNIENSIDLLLSSLSPRILAAPAFLDALASQLLRLDLSFSFVKEIRTGGGPVLPQLIDKLVKVFPQARIWSIYGSTEAEPIASLEVGGALARFNDEAARGAGLIQGYVNDCTTLVIADPSRLRAHMTEASFQAALNEIETVGEILVAGAHVVSGYIDGQGDSENKVRVGGRIFHRTGDIGFVDADGLLHLCGRRGQAVKLPTDDCKSVYPLQIEALTYSRSAFLEVAGKRVLVIEGEGEPGLTERLNAFGHKLGLQRDNLVERIVSSPIPMDRRHHSKVLYGELRERLLRQFSVRRI